MNLPEGARASPTLEGASITAEVSRHDDADPSRQTLSSPPSASAERLVHPDRLPLDAQLPDRPPPLDGFIKHYEIIRKLGEGGMGIVLLARDTKLGRLVAIKLLQDSGRATARLLAEARATALCRHESIVVIYDVDETDGHPYMVLEHLEGRTLRAVLSSSERGASRALPKGLALDIVIAVARALAAAHERDIVHRDLKPENVMILDAGGVKLLDFGMARPGGALSARARGGTLPYMAPEQWRGEDIDARTDLWAVGVLLFELLVGAHPLAPLTMARLEGVADPDAPMPRLRDAVPELAALSDVVERCLRKPKEARFPSAAALLAALEPLRDAGRPVTLAEGELPFAGLSAFQESDAGRFFGRARDVAAAVERLRRQRLVTVAAPSGAGKSSFVRAGVIPALKRSGEDWDVLVMRPGRDPLSSLGEALAQVLAPDGAVPRPLATGELRAEPGLLGALLRAHCRARGAGSRTLVFVDQFEELYTLVPDPAERAAFLGSLLGAADEVSSPLRVVLAIRWDFLDRVSDNRHVMAEITAGLFPLPSVGREGLREALVRPVEAAGHRFESEAMITEILDELAHAKTPLPLLQFAAAELWEARDRERHLLSRGSYERLGGVAGALSTHADAVFAGLSPPDQRLCQAIFLRLVTPERTRAIVSMPELASLAEDPAATEALVQHLCGARLLLLEIGGDPGSVTVELVHESLIERWPRLARWLDESTADARFLSRLRAAASQWQAGGEAPGLLWRDHAAADARAWYERRRASPDTAQNLSLGHAEGRYLLAVIALFDRARRRRQRIAAALFAAISAVAVVVSGLGIGARAEARRADEQSKRTDEQARRADEQAKQAQEEARQARNATRMAAARAKQGDPTTVLALLREIEPGPVPRGWAGLALWARGAGVAEVVLPHTAEIYSAAFSPDGQRIVTGSRDLTVQVWNADGAGAPLVLRGHDERITTVAFSPDGQRIVSASLDKTARVWNADGTGAPIVLRHDALVWSAAFSPDGRHIVTGSLDKTVRVWNADGKGAPLVLRGHDADVHSVAWSPDGQRIVSASEDKTVRVWNADGKGAPLVLRGHDHVVWSAAWSPDSKRIVSASTDKTVRVWNADGTGAPLILRGNTEDVLSVAWSPDGQRIVSTAGDATVRVWNADGTGAPLILRGHDSGLWSAAWSPDGKRIVSASLDNTARVWNVDGKGAPLVLRGHDSSVLSAAWSPDGQRIVSASWDNTVRVWNADGTGAPLILRGHVAGLWSATWSPDGKHIVSASGDKTVRVWNADGTGAPLVLRGHESTVGWAAFSPDSQHIASASADKTVRVWNADGTGAPLVLRGHDAGVWFAAWSPDGQRIASASEDRTVRVWNADGTGLPLVLRGHDANVNSAAWSPDGQRIVSASSDKTVRVWNADGTGLPLVLRGHEVTASVRGERPFSLDGRRIISASNDTTVRLWNADGTGESIVLLDLDLPVNTASWSPDGKRIVAASDDKTIVVFSDVQPAQDADDPRLWAATQYCMPLVVRQRLLNFTEAQSRTDLERCQRRVEETRAAERERGGAPSRDTLRP